MLPLFLSLVAGIGGIGDRSHASGPMWKRRALSTAVAAAGAAARCSQARRFLSSASVVAELRHSLEEHHQEISKLAPTPKKASSPPPPFALVKGALERSEGPVLRREFGEEKITVSVMRRALALPSDSGDFGGVINELLIHVDVSKPDRENSLLFLCALYPDAVGIHSVCLLSKITAGCYHGRVYLELDLKLRDAFDLYLEERRVDRSLFSYLHNWLYVKDHRNLMGWFKTVSNFLSV